MRTTIGRPRPRYLSGVLSKQIDPTPPDVPPQYFVSSYFGASWFATRWF